MGESEAGHGQSISQAYDGIQAEGRWAVQEIAAAERARHARRGVCCRDIPSQGRGLRRLRRAPPKGVQGGARQGSRHRRSRGPAGHAPVGLPEATGRKRPGVRGHRLNPLHEKVREARRHWLRFHRKAPRGRDGEERCGRLAGQTCAPMPLRKSSPNGAIEKLNTSTAAVMRRFRGPMLAD